jgi:crotonobetainyl-CoA:carnitine CoA-transferase CaiB-like acyl-CoA transferase
MQSYQIFQGVKVLELAGVLAGPAVGQFFAELGADVVKVESPKEGDVTRSWRLPTETDSTTISAYFSSVNWGKRSLIARLSDPAQLQVVRALALEADIVLTSFRPGDDIRYGLDYKTLSGQKPSLVYGKITGYPHPSARVGYDAVVQAESGFMYLNRPPNTEPLKMPVALVDVLAAHQLKEGLLVAMLHLRQSGKGCAVTVSLYEAAISALTNQASNFFASGFEPQPLGSAHPNIAPYGTLYRTADDRHLLLAVGNDRQFNALRKVLGMPADSRFVTNPDRVRNREALEQLLSSTIASLQSTDLLEKLEAEQIPAGLIQTVGEALQHPHSIAALHRSLFGTGVRQAVFALDQKKGHSLNPPPQLGENTTDVLQDWLGYLPDRAEAWKRVVLTT